MRFPRIIIATMAFVVVSCLSSDAQTMDMRKLSRNFRKQAEIIKAHRRDTDRLKPMADSKVWDWYKTAEADYVKSLKAAYKYQKHPKKFQKALEDLKHHLIGYRAQIKGLFTSLNINGATVGRTRYGPLDEFEKVHNEFKALTK